nr:NUDIX hydrolase [Rhizobium cremeum]
MPKKKTFLMKLAETGGPLFTAKWLEQYAAICFRRSPETGAFEVLLITARGSGRWVIPKGGPMKGKTPREVAAQEAFEEAGVRGKVGKKPLGRYSYVKRLDNGENLPCIVEVFTLETVSVAEAFKEQGQRQAVWVRLAEAGSYVEEPELRGLFAKLETRLRKIPPDTA